MITIKEKDLSILSTFSDLYIQGGHLHVVEQKRGYWRTGLLHRLYTECALGSLSFLGFSVLVSKMKGVLVPSSQGSILALASL